MKDASPKNTKNKQSVLNAGKAKKAGGKKFPIVAIGASAGGLEAITELLTYLPADTGMAFIYVQHLDPYHESMLTSLLERVSKVKVIEAKDAMKMQPNCFYVIPPNTEMFAIDSIIKLMPRRTDKSRHMPIDSFFISISQEEKERAIGIILSGAASDGTAGLKAIKIAGGFTIVQDESAKFQSMPRSAIAEGVVDLILSPKEIAGTLESFSRNVNFMAVKEAVRNEEIIPDDHQDLQDILQLINKFTGVDFTHYKMNTIKRRIVRRMLLHKFDKLSPYLKFLKTHADEVNLLYNDLLINVTAFFRDQDTVDYLKNVLLPKLLKSKSSAQPLRIWIPACATGEEAYSLGMIIMEIIDKVKHANVQIFATDLSELAISKARLGIYTKNDVADISPKRLQSFFNKEDGSYRIIKPIRDMVVFAPHNIFKDPPFSRIDLVSCCNVLIYLDSILQRKAMSIFHYALNEGGYLLLGKSESIGSSSRLFTAEDKRVKIYTRKNNSSTRSRFETSDLITSANPAIAAYEKSQHPKLKGDNHFEKMVDDLLLKHFVPASVVVNKDFDIVQFKGSTGLFLEPSPGKASLNLIRMARPGLGFELRNALHKVVKTGKPVKKDNVEIDYDQSKRNISFNVWPMKNDMDESCFLVVMEEIPLQQMIKEVSQSKDGKLKKLEAELLGAREDMRGIIEQGEAAYQELQSANEEIVSSNEELQSINEELETSKEELESTNEELIAVNHELQITNDRLSEAQEYNETFFRTVREGILILDKNLCVKTANKAFYKMFRTNEQETEGHLFFELANRSWDSPELRDLLENIVPKNLVFHDYEITHQLKGKDNKVFLLNAQQLNLKIHRERMILLAIEDITDKRGADDKRKQYASTLELKNTELKQSNGELQQFAYVASHDLQEPLRKIITFVSVLQKKHKASMNEESRDYIQRINESATRMSVLIEDLLNFSRTTRSTFRFSNVDLKKAVNKVMKDFDLIMQQKNAVIKVGNLPTLKLIPVQMEQLFHNLLSNSLKFADTSKETVIQISSHKLSKKDMARFPALKKDRDAFEIIVRDNGIGFDQVYAEKIFTIFQRLHGKDEYSGTGIGLALCKKIVENHGGEIFAESIEHEGSAFHIILQNN